MSNCMQPTMPEPAHTHTPAARLESMELEEGPNSWQQKRSLHSMEGVSAEWKFGSRKRVIKYYVVYLGIGLFIGAVVGVVIGVIFRFT